MSLDELADKEPSSSDEVQFAPSDSKFRSLSPAPIPIPAPPSIRSLVDSIDDIRRSSDIEILILIIQERRSKYWLPSSTSMPALFNDHMMSADAIRENKILAEAKCIVPPPAIRSHSAQQWRCWHQHRSWLLPDIRDLADNGRGLLSSDGGYFVNIRQVLLLSPAA